MSQLTDNDIKRIRSILGCGWQATAEEKSKDALSIIYSLNKAECINLVESLCKEFRASFDLQASNPSGSGHQSEVMRAERSNFTACEMVLDSLRK